MAVYQSADVYADMKCSKSKLPRDSAVALPQIHRLIRKEGGL